MWLSHVLRRNALRAPGQLALRDSRRMVTWQDMTRDVAALATALAQAAAPGERILVLSGNLVEMIEAYFACAVAGVIAAPVNPQLTDVEISYLIESLEPAAVLADQPGRDRAATRWPGYPVLAIEEVAGLPAALDAPARLAQYHGPAQCPGLTTPAAILHTSATTGRPKGVVIDQRSLQLNATSWIADVGVPAGTVFLNAGPLFHGSMVIALDYLAAGATVCVLDQFTPAGCLRAMQSWRVTHAFLVPSMVRLLLQSRALGDTDLSALELLLHGAAPMPPDLADHARARLGAQLQTIFGITEGGGPVISLRPGEKPADPPVPGAVCAGVPMLGTDALIVLADGGAAAVGEVGEIMLAGDGAMQGYWRDPAATEAAFKDGWLNTHDLGCVGADGYIWSVDRRNDLILRGGQNVYPAEIEHVLRSVPSVADAAVVPAPSPAWGQTPVAFVEPAPGSSVDLDRLIDACIARLASYKRPSRFVVVDQIPRNAAGKILRASLRARVEDMIAGPAEETG
jgi:acyl-CoA synthetase (AMP-forming)/AMP-acid ligase II